jgi:ABC-type multidrug transport system ATPase subunit
MSGVSNHTSAIDIEGMTVRLRGVVLIDDVTVSFAAGAVHAVVGRSGAGKSVLMKAALGLLPLAHGRVQLHAQPCVYVHQDPALVDDLTVRENLAFVLRRTQHPHDTCADDVITHVLHDLDLQSVAHLPPAQLALGVQRRVALARALCVRPRTLVIDEPTTGLDPLAADVVDEALTRIAITGTTLIVITHSPRTLRRLDPTVTLVDSGRVTQLPRSAA